jgi:hypothetical protein
MWLFALAVSACAVAASAVRLRRVRTAQQSSPAELARLLGRAGSVDRLRRMAAEVREAGAAWEADLLDDIIGADSEAARVALANEHLGDLAARLDWGSHIPVAASRLSIAVPLCVVFFALARGALAWSSILPTAFWAGVGAVASLWVGRKADRVAAGLREAVDLLVERSLRAAASRSRPGDSQ